ncbi:MAG: Phenylacetic acid catabolic protein [Actinomycetota bacterium]
MTTAADHDPDDGTHHGTVNGTVGLDAGSRSFLLALADDEHMIGARHTAWIGLGPFLEEDLAFCSIAQDELGHSIGLYELLLRDAGRDPTTELDAFALLRPPAEYRSSHLAEVECSDWADSLVRHWLYDRAERHRWSALLESSHPGIAALAARASAEERFHLDHAERFMVRVAQAEPIAAAVDRLLPLAVAAWWSVPGEDAALAAGVAAVSSPELAARWEAEIRDDAARWGVALTWPDCAQSAVLDHIDRTVRSDGFDTFHAGLTAVLSLEPSATW